MKKLILGALLGGIVLFAWGTISWMLIPWHEPYLQAFKDEAAVAEVLKTNAPNAGLYMMPGDHDAATTDKNWEEGARRMADGPFVFGVVRTTRQEWNLGRLLLGSFLIQTIGAFIITALLLTTRIPRYFGRVLFVATLGGLIGVLGHLPAYNWWEFPAGWTLINIMDLAIGWTLGGLVLAAITKPRAPGGARVG